MNDTDDARFVQNVGKYIVKVIPSKCISAGSCVAISPDVFKLNEDSIAEIIENGKDDEDNILLAAQSCPTGAVEIYEGEKKVWPL